MYHLTVFVGPESGPGLSGTLLRVSQAINSVVSQGWVLNRGLTKEGSTSKLLQVIGRRIHFLATVRFMAVCFLKASNGESMWVSLGRAVPYSYVMLSSNHVYISSPFQHSIISNRVTGPAHTHREETTQRHEHQQAGSQGLPSSIISKTCFLLLVSL